MGGTNKVRQLLSDEEISALFDDLRSMPGMNGPAFAGLMREKGYVLGHNAANHFIQNEFKPYLESLKRQKALAIFLTELQRGRAFVSAEIVAAQRPHWQGFRRQLARGVIFFVSIKMRYWGNSTEMIDSEGASGQWAADAPPGRSRAWLLSKSIGPLLVRRRHGAFYTT